MYIYNPPRHTLASVRTLINEQSRELGRSSNDNRILLADKFKSVFKFNIKLYNNFFMPSISSIYRLGRDTAKPFSRNFGKKPTLFTKYHIPTWKRKHEIQNAYHSVERSLQVSITNIWVFTDLYTHVIRLQRTSCLGRKVRHFFLSCALRRADDSIRGDRINTHNNFYIYFLDNA